MTRVEVIAAALVNVRRMQRGESPEHEPLATLGEEDRRKVMDEAEWVATKLEQFEAEGADGE